MVDMKKRNAMKVIGGTAVVASVPSLAVANAALGGSATHLGSSVPGVEVPLNTGTELSMTMSLENNPTVTITNNSEEEIALKHVHPGVVHAGARTFDINSVFKSGVHSLKSGESRVFNIETTLSTQSETIFPRHLYKNQPQRVVSINGYDHFGEVINSSRSFYA